MIRKPGFGRVEIRSRPAMLSDRLHSPRCLHMNITTILLFPSSHIPLLLSSPALAQRDMDQIYLSKGAPARGSIPPDGMIHDPTTKSDKVTIDQSGGPRSIEVNEIVRITFAGEPTELVAGRNNVLQKNYNQALAELKKLDGQKIDRPFIKQDIEFYKALCQARLALSEGGDKKAATDAMFNFVRSAPQSYHFYEAAVRRQTASACWDAGTGSVRYAASVSVNATTSSRSRNGRTNGPTCFRSTSCPR